MPESAGGDAVFAELNVESNAAQVAAEVNSSLQSMGQQAAATQSRFKQVAAGAQTAGQAAASIAKGGIGLVTFGGAALLAARRMGLLSGKAQDAADKLAKSRRELRSLLSVATAAPIALKLASAGLVAMATGAAMYASKLETATATQRALIGVSKQAASTVTAASREIAMATGQSFDAMSAAGYTLQSAGLRGKDALDALQVAGRAAQVGLGDAQTAASALTVALRAWGSTGESSASIMDKIHAAAKRGTAAASEYAGSLGQVAPMARELGVSAADTLGVVAELTKGNNSAAQSVTMLRGVFTQLIRPAAEAETALEGLGISISDVQQRVSADLVGGLVWLRAKLEEAGLSLSDMFGDVEGLNAVLQITGDNARDFAAAQQEVLHSTGGLNDAVDIVADTLQNRMGRAVGSLKDMMFSLGGVALPAVSTALNVVAAATRTVASNFEFFVGGGLLVVVTSAYVTIKRVITGTLATLVAKIKAATVAAGGLKAMLAGLALNPLVLGITAVVGAVSLLAWRLGEARKESKRFADAIEVAEARYEAENELLAAAVTTLEEYVRLKQAAADATANTPTLSVWEDLQSTADWSGNAQRELEQLMRFGPDVEQLAANFVEAESELQRFLRQHDVTEQQFRGRAAQQSRRLRALEPEYRALAGSVDVADTALRDYITAIQDEGLITGSTSALRGKVVEHLERQAKARVVTNELAKQGAKVAFEEAAAFAVQDERLYALTRTLQTQVAQGTKTAETAYVELAEAINAIPELKEMMLEADDSGALAGIANVGAALDQLPDSKTVTIHTNFTDPTLPRSIRMYHRNASWAARRAHAERTSEAPGRYEPGSNWIPTWLAEYNRKADPVAVDAYMERTYGTDAESDGDQSAVDPRADLIASWREAQQVKRRLEEYARTLGADIALLPDLARQAAQAGMNLSELPEDMMNALRQGVEDKLAEAARAANAELARGLMGLADTVIADQFAEALLGTPQQIQDAFDRLLQTATANGLLSESALSAAMKHLEQQIGDLKVLAARRGELAEMLREHQDKLRDLQRSHEQMEQRITSRMRVSIADTLTVEDASTVVKKMSDFRDRIVALSRRGFPPDLIAEVVQLGLSEGSAAAKQLLNMQDADLRQVVELNNQIRGLAGSIGKTTADLRYRVEIENTEKTVSQLRNYLEQTEAKMELLAGAIQTDFVNAVSDMLKLLDLPESMKKVLDGWLDVMALRLGKVADRIASAQERLDAARRAERSPVWHDARGGAHGGRPTLSDLEGYRRTAVYKPGDEQLNPMKQRWVYNPETGAVRYVPRARAGAPDLLPLVPRLATGGIVTAPTLAFLGERSRPEAVIPLDRAQAMGFGRSNGGIVIEHLHVETRDVDELREQLLRLEERYG